MEKFKINKVKCTVKAEDDKILYQESWPPLNEPDPDNYTRSEAGYLAFKEDYRDWALFKSIRNLKGDANVG